MTDQELVEFEAGLDEEIEEKNVEYHFDNFLKNVIGVHDLNDTCEHCIGHFITASATAYRQKIRGN